MKITKFTHACVRLDDDGRILVIDPGEWTEPEALAGAQAVLITHEHADHVEPSLLAGLGLPIFAPDGADIEGLEGVTRVNSGDQFEAAGFKVRAVGSRHAFIYQGRPDCPNLGYVVNEAVYHPGDSVFVPDGPVETVLAPVQGSWVKLVEVLDFVRAINQLRTIPIHDAGLSERGLDSVNSWFERVTDNGYRYLAPGAPLET